MKIAINNICWLFCLSRFEVLTPGVFHRNKAYQHSSIHPNFISSTVLVQYSLSIKSHKSIFCLPWLYGDFLDVLYFTLRFGLPNSNLQFLLFTHGKGMVALPAVHRWLAPYLSDWHSQVTYFLLTDPRNALSPLLPDESFFLASASLTLLSCLL